MYLWVEENNIDKKISVDSNFYQGFHCLSRIAMTWSYKMLLYIRRLDTILRICITNKGTSPWKFHTYNTQFAEGEVF